MNQHELQGTTMVQPPTPTPPWEILQDRMRGRWRFAIPLGLLLGAACAVAGYMLMPVEYVAKSGITVEPYLPAILEETPETGMMPAFDLFRGDQIASLQDERIIFRVWSKLPDTMKAQFRNRSTFADGYEITGRRDSSFIDVQYAHTDPQTAATAVNLLLDEYEATAPGRAFFVYVESRVQQRLDEAQQLYNALQRERRDFISSSEYAKYTFEDMRTQLSEDGIALRQRINQIDRALASLPGAEDDLGTAQDTVANGDESAIDETLEPTRQDLLAFDDELRRREAALRSAEVSLEQLSTEIGPQHWRYRRALKAYELEQQDFEAYLELVRNEWMTMNGATDLLATSDPAQLREQRVELEEQLATIDEKMEALWLERDRLRDLDLRISKAEDALSMATDRMQGLQNNRDAIERGRVEIRGEALVPESPENDRRRVAAVGGFMGGLALPIALFFLIGTIDKRAYAASQLMGTDAKYDCIGVLPDLSDAKEDPEASALAAQCVHRLRNRIEMQRNPHQSYVVSISSPFQGDGKTSVAFALGWSYAASGCRTLLVDCDFTGRSLSYQTGRLREAGLKECLIAGKVNGEVVTTPRRNLSVLGVGRSKRFGAEAVRPTELAKLFATLREQFDVIIVDTGPLLGCVEAIPVVTASDGVILTLRRGRPRTRLDECINEIRRAGASYLGVVLNCAVRSDCERYSSTSRVSAEVASVHDTNGISANGTAKESTDRSFLIQALEGSEQPADDDHPS